MPIDSTIEEDRPLSLSELEQFVLEGTVPKQGKNKQQELKSVASKQPAPARHRSEQSATIFSTQDTGKQVTADTLSAMQSIQDSTEVIDDIQNSMTAASDSLIIPEKIKEWFSLTPVFKKFSDSTAFAESMMKEETLFREEEEHAGLEGNPIDNGIQNQVWFTPLLFVLFFIYGLTFFRKRKTFGEEVKSFFSPLTQHNRDLYRSDSFADSFQTRTVLITLGIVNIALFSFFAVSELFDFSTTCYIQVLLFYFASVLVFFLFKTGMIKLIAYVFFDRSLSGRWTRAHNSFILFFGIVLIPVILFLSFGPSEFIGPAIYVGLFFGAALLIFYLLKVVTFFFQSLSSLFYLILYLCTLEILPLLILFWGLKRISGYYNLI